MWIETWVASWLVLLGPKRVDFHFQVVPNLVPEVPSYFPSRYAPEAGGLAPSYLPSAVPNVLTPNTSLSRFPLIVPEFSPSVPSVNPSTVGSPALFPLTFPQVLFFGFFVHPLFFCQRIRECLRDEQTAERANEPKRGEGVVWW